MTPSPSSQPKWPPVCSGCGNRPALDNDPCAVCGRSSQEEARELKACPFCAAIPNIAFSHEAGQWDVYEIECDCGVSVYGPCGYEGDEAKAATIRKWNRRPTPDLGDVDELVEELRELKKGWVTSKSFSKFIDRVADTIIALRAALKNKGD